MMVNQFNATASVIANIPTNSISIFDNKKSSSLSQYIRIWYLKNDLIGIIGLSIQLMYTMCILILKRL